MMTTIYLVRCGNLYLTAAGTCAEHFNDLDRAEIFTDKQEAIEAAERMYASMNSAKQIEVVPFIMGCRPTKIGFES